MHREGARFWCVGFEGLPSRRPPDLSRSRRYEYGDADLVCAFDMLDTWVDRCSQDGALANVAPDAIPYVSLSSMIFQARPGRRILLGKTF